MSFCEKCIFAQYCKRLVTTVFTDDELRRSFFQSDMKAFLVAYTFEHHILPSEWHDDTQSRDEIKPERFKQERQPSRAKARKRQSR